MTNLLARLDGRELERRTAAVHPEWCEPVLAKPTELRKRLDGVARTGASVVDEVRDPAVTFARLKLVAEIGFTEGAADGRLRGLRRDKRPEPVGRERTGP